jgi:hypothetical protein
MLLSSGAAHLRIGCDFMNLVVVCNEVPTLGRDPDYDQPNDEGSAQPTHIPKAMSEEFARQ